MTINGAAIPPRYIASGYELAVFEAAWRSQLAVMLKGPTGCGKTRLVEHMAHRLGLPLFSISCHEDITSADLIGRHVLTGGATEWVDGPLTRAVREGGICYLDEVVEARQDATVAIHSLTDHRRELFIERLGGVRLQAPPPFCLVVSYNPGYQSVLKDLKTSTRQRLVSITLGFPPPDQERTIVRDESSIDPETADVLVRLAQALRRIEDAGLREVPSTRLLVDAAKLIMQGLPRREAIRAAIIEPLTDSKELVDGLEQLANSYVGRAGA